MFSVLVIADDAGFFRRRRLFRAPQVRDVRVYGGLPFREIISARRRGKINRAAICEAAGRCSGTMLLPEDIAPGGGIDEPDLSDYRKLVFFNTACSILRSSCGCGVRGELLIKDKNASAAQRLGVAVPLFSDIRDFVPGRVFAPDRKRHGRIRRGGSRRNQRQRGCSYRPRFVARKVCLRRRSFYGGKNNAPQRICASHADGRGLA